MAEKVCCESMDTRSQGMSSLDKDIDEEVVHVKPDVNNKYADLSISCADATGLGCDIARILFNFGLTVSRGDFSTDGRWCFLMLRVEPCAKAPPCSTNWKLLRQHLLDCTLWHRSDLKNSNRFKQTFLLQIRFQDRIGSLHHIIEVLWETGLVVHKANMSTSPDNRGLDVFYVSDSLNLLPKAHRVDELKRRLSEAVRDYELQFDCIALPEDQFSEDWKGSCRLSTGTRSCKDSTASLPLQRNPTWKKESLERSSRASSEDSGELKLSNDALVVASDNLVSPTHTVLHIECKDRKGLMYDLFRIAKDINLQISYGKIDVDPKNGICRTDLFVHECELGQKLNEEMTAYSCAEIRNAVSNSIQITVCNKTQIMENKTQSILQTELLAVAPVDSGFRGRPRVLYDLTSALHEMGVSIFHAEMYTEEGPSSGEIKRYHEIHKFVLQGGNANPLCGNEDIRYLERALLARLMGSHFRGKPSKDKASEMSIMQDFIYTGILA